MNKASTGAGLQSILFGADLKLFFTFLCNFQGLNPLEVSYEYRQDFVCADHGVRPMDKLFSHCSTLQWRLGCAPPDLRRTVSRHGLCPTDLARKPSRYRSDAGRQCRQTLCHGLSPQRAPIHPGRCQRVARLAHLVRLGSGSDPARSQALRGRGLGARTQEHGLRTGRHHHRFVSEPVRLGAVSQSQGRSQAPYAAGPARLYPSLHPHQRWQDARGQCAGHLGPGARRVLRHRPGLFGLCSPVPNASSRRLLCDPCQKQYERQARVLGQGGQNQRHHLRSGHCVERTLCSPRLPRALEAHSLQRPPNPKDLDLLDQQHGLAALDHSCVVQKPLAGGIVLQMDQTAPSHKEVSGQQRERSKDANLVCRTQGMQPHMQPHALTVDEIATTVAEYAQSANLAIEAGFDGVELHAANGYLIEQFLNANVNKREDAYGGSAANRNRFALEVMRATIAAIGADRVGMRISPFGVFNATGAFDGVEAQYEALVNEASDLGLMYLHLLDHSAMGAPVVPATLKSKLRSMFKGTFILAGGFTGETAEQALGAGQADLIGFGRPFISNPDLVARLQKGSQLAAPNMNTFYTPGEAGYTDYPTQAA